MKQSLVMDSSLIASQTIPELCHLLGYCYENENAATASGLRTELMGLLHCIIAERPRIDEPSLMAKEMLEFEGYGDLFWGLGSPSELTWPADSSR